jgi:hypothetical protein
MSRSPLERVMQGLFSEQALSPAVAEPFRAAVVRARREAVAAVIARGTRRGRARVDADVELANELLVGPVDDRLLFGGFPPDVGTRVMDAVLAGDAPRAAGPAARGD